MAYNIAINEKVKNYLLDFYCQLWKDDKVQINLYLCFPKITKKLKY